MKDPTLEERVARLENEIAELRGLRSDTPAPDAWRRTVGRFDDDPIIGELIEEGRRIREADRRESVS